MCCILLIIFCVNLCCWLSTSDTFCEGPNGPACCNGFMWNTNTGECIKCTLGFTGIACSLKCLYPNYGENCQLNCLCSVEDCHYASGCKGKKEQEIKTTTTIFGPNIIRNFSEKKASQPRPEKTTMLHVTYITSKAEMHSISTIPESDIYISNELSLSIVLISVGILVVSISVSVFFIRKTNNCSRILGRPRTNLELQDFNKQFPQPEQQIAQPKNTDTIYEEIPENTIKNYSCYDINLCENDKMRSTDQDEISYIEPLTEAEIPLHCTSDSRLSYLTAVP